jgi:hypothetical protein
MLDRARVAFTTLRRLFWGEWFAPVAPIAIHDYTICTPRIAVSNRWTQLANRISSEHREVWLGQIERREFEMTKIESTH